MRGVILNTVEAQPHVLIYLPADFKGLLSSFAETDISIKTNYISHSENNIIGKPSRMVLESQSDVSECDTCPQLMKKKEVTKNICAAEQFLILSDINKCILMPCVFCERRADEHNTL